MRYIIVLPQKSVLVCLTVNRQPYGGMFLFIGHAYTWVCANESLFEHLADRQEKYQSSTSTD